MLEFLFGLFVSVSGLDFFHSSFNRTQNEACGASLHSRVICGITILDALDVDHSRLRLAFFREGRGPVTPLWLELIIDRQEVCAAPLRNRPLDFDGKRRGRRSGQNEGNQPTVDVGEFHKQSCHQGTSGQDGGAGPPVSRVRTFGLATRQSQRPRAKKVQHARMKIKPLLARFGLPQKRFLVCFWALLSE